MEARSRLYRAATAIEDATGLDPAAAAVRRRLPAALERGPVRDVLGGRWLGHAFHPLLTDFPLGSWMAASLLDVLPGSGYEEASRRLLEFGLLAAVPTIAAGWSDWLQADDRQRRVGLVHAAVNATATTLYGLSLLTRRAGHRPLGVGLGVAGGLVATVGGFFGGHLSLATDAGLRSTRDVLGVS